MVRGAGSRLESRQALGNQQKGVNDTEADTGEFAGGKLADTSETHWVRPYVEKCCQGSGVDVGCGSEKIAPDAIGIDFAVGDDFLSQLPPWAMKQMNSVEKSGVIGDYSF
jgi:hypothetical protein